MNHQYGQEHHASFTLQAAAFALCLLPGRDVRLTPRPGGCRRRHGLRSGCAHGVAARPSSAPFSRFPAQPDTGTMGKRKTNKFARPQFSPIGQTNNTGGLEEEVAADVFSPAGELLEKLQSVSPDVREFACASISKLVQEKKVIPSFLQKDAIRCLGPMLLDPSVAVRETAAGALRNLSACGGYDVCDEMVKQDVLTPLTALLRECCTGLDTNMANPQKNQVSDKNYIEDVSNEAIHLLWNLCESSSRAVSVFNKEGLLDICILCLRRFNDNIELAISAAYCLQTVTEDNTELLASLVPLALQVLEVVLLSSEDITEHLLLRTLVAGTVWNVKSIVPSSSQADTINAVIRILAETLEKNASQIILTLRQAACGIPKAEAETEMEEEMIDTNENVTPKLEDGTGKIPHQSQAENVTSEDISDFLPTRSEELRHATALLAAQQNALEIIVNMCCSEDPSDDEWEEMSSSDESDNCMTEGSGTLFSPLCLSAEVHSALINYLIPKKVLEKTEFTDSVTVDACMESPSWRHLIEKMKRIQCRALTCLHNLLSVLDVEGLGGPDALYSLSQHLGKLVFSQSEVPKDSEFLEAVTSAIRSLMQIMSSHNLPQQCMSAEQLMILCEAGAQCENTSARVNVVAMMGISGNVIAKEDNTAETLKMMGNFLLQVVTKDSSLVVVGEALDAIIDVFADGKEADKAADEMKLVHTLKSFQPVFKLRIQKEGKGNLTVDQRLVLDNVKINLRRFIAYREALMKK
ncbi:HEAT repeat-containing protein 3 [Pristis pectinata]|uniref:HEAT repeat-containing protein 3 n=1 Tax=Pristis pectinata TaxID=685728 RepID=UPI00223D4198|nr:HEAT repeat-containing protein 3 [Pristis pectinata]